VASVTGSGVATVNDRLVKLLFFLATGRENGSAQVAAVVPYLA
jgi:ribose-phosphate pyrophosphokinase